MVEMMKKKMKNATEWEKLENEALLGTRNEVECLIQMNNGEEYQWKSKPLINDQLRHIGRFSSMKKTKTKTAGRKK
jgi:hypothetical protein